MVQEDGHSDRSPDRLRETESRSKKKDSGDDRNAAKSRSRSSVAQCASRSPSHWNQRDGSDASSDSDSRRRSSGSSRRCRHRSHEKDSKLSRGGRSDSRRRKKLRRTPTRERSRSPWPRRGNERNPSSKWPDLQGRTSLSERSLRPPRRKPGTRHEVVFGVVYWGGAGDGWNLNHWAQTPQICGTCDGVQDAWRGRFDNAQVTLRMCAAEGVGFKRYIRSFLMLSSRAAIDFDLPAFYRWSVAQRKKVLTERVVLGTLLGVHRGRHRARDCGVFVDNSPGSWKGVFGRVAQQMRDEVEMTCMNGGKLAVLILDAHGQELNVSDMLEHRGPSNISRLLIILGGPDGIHPKSANDLQELSERFSHFSLLRCSLPGGKMHSYYALATLFVMHDQGLLLPFLTHMSASQK